MLWQIDQAAESTWVKKKKKKNDLSGFPKKGQTGYKGFQGIYIWLGPLTNFWISF